MADRSDNAPRRPGRRSTGAAGRAAGGDARASNPFAGAPPADAIASWPPPASTPAGTRRVAQRGADARGGRAPARARSRAEPPSCTPSASSTGTSLHATRTRTPQRSAAGPRGSKGRSPSPARLFPQGVCWLDRLSGVRQPRPPQPRTLRGRPFSLCREARSAEPASSAPRRASWRLGDRRTRQGCPSTGHPQVWDPSWRPRWLSTTTA